MQLFSDKMLIRMFSGEHPGKPNNSQYNKLKARLKEYPLSDYRRARIVPYDFVEEFMNCIDFLAGDLHHYRFASKEDGTERHLYVCYVLPAGNTKRTTYRFIVEGFDERMLDKTLFEKED